MKLDYEAVQFERQLKRATRLSLLEFAASERRRQMSNSMRTRRTKKSIKTSKNTKIIRSRLPFSARKLHSTANNIIARRKMAQNARARKNQLRRLTVKYPHAYGDSRKYGDGPSSPRLSRLNLDARLEIMWSDKVDGADSGFDDNPSTENSVDETEKFGAEKLPQPSFRLVKDYTPPAVMSPRPDSYYRLIEQTPEDLDNEVEYDVDEEDLSWLKLLNESRLHHKPRAQPVLSVEAFEIVMDRLEKEAHNLGQHIVTTGAPTASAPAVSDDDAVCAICCDDECTNVNAILFCDSCNLAVHQDCYGVPYVPEGQWLCRRCQAGIADDVACCMCPIRGGAVKRTNDGRWAHVVCALWIPECGFGSIELLEPVTKLHRVPPARRRLTCAVCNKSQAGACIQCMHKNCYKAFHITCAQRVGLYMKIEPILDSAGVMINVSKTLLCNDHKPPGARPFQPMIDNSIDNDGRPPAPPKDKSRPRSQAQGCRRRRDRKNAPAEIDQSTCNVPLIPVERLEGVLECLPKKDKRNVLATLQTYWLLKRRSRNGLPLLRRLQVSIPPAVTTKSKGSHESKTVWTDIMRVKKLRQEMEKVRLLLELIRKRERTKRELMRSQEMLLRVKLEPLAIHLHRTIDQLQLADTAKIFGRPVTLQEAPDYLIRIKHPMDFSTMRSKVDAYEYKTFKEFETDFWHIVNNGRTYNSDGSLYYNLAVILGDKPDELKRRSHRQERTSLQLIGNVQGKPILDAARQLASEANYSLATGLHSASSDEEKSSVSSPGLRCRRDSKSTEQKAYSSPQKTRSPSKEMADAAVRKLPTRRKHVSSPVALSPSRRVTTGVTKDEDQSPVRRSPTRSRRLSAVESVSPRRHAVTDVIEDGQKPNVVSPSRHDQQDNTQPSQRRTRSSHSSDAFESLPLRTVNKRKRSVGTSGDDDEPPELSRCPSPVDESVFPRLISTVSLSAKADYHETSSSDPPSLTRSLPDNDSSTKDTLKAADVLSSRGVGTSDAKDAADPRDFVVTRSSMRRVGSPDDTLDSVSSTESHIYGSANCDCIMPTLTADCDSSYGSTCGRAGAAVSDSEATAGSETETDRTDRMPILKSCDVC